MCLWFRVGFPIQSSNFLLRCVIDSAESKLLAQITNFLDLVFSSGIEMFPHILFFTHYPSWKAIKGHNKICSDYVVPYKTPRCHGGFGVRTQCDQQLSRVGTIFVTIKATEQHCQNLEPLHKTVLAHDSFIQIWNEKKTMAKVVVLMNLLKCPPCLRKFLSSLWCDTGLKWQLLDDNL